MRKLKILTLLFISALFLSTFATSGSAAMTSHGPYLDKVVYKFISGSDKQFLALQSGEVDLIDGTIDPTYIPIISSIDNLDYAETPVNGYAYLAFNCGKYPFNISAFRIAVAYVMDKNSICDNAFNGFAEPLDVFLPAGNPFSIEGSLPFSYHQQDILSANQTLDDAGFVDDTGDGWRDAPDGSEFTLEISVPQQITELIEAAISVKEQLVDIGVKADVRPVENDQLVDMVYNTWPKVYDSVLGRFWFTGLDPYWAYCHFSTDYIDAVEYGYGGYNPFYWCNDTMDWYLYDMIEAPTFDDVYAASAAAQELFIEHSPIIPIATNIVTPAYRTDKFEGFVLIEGKDMTNPWTNSEVHLKSGEFGGTLSYATGVDIGTTFNVMDLGSIMALDMFNNLYDSLARMDEDGLPQLWLASSINVEVNWTHWYTYWEGGTELYVDLIENATWTDGEPLTAVDVAFTYEYFMNATGHAFPGLDQIIADVTVLDEYSLKFDCWYPTYFLIEALCYTPIIPEHVWSQIPYADWDTYDPSMDDLVTSGPFTITGYVADEFLELSYREDYYYGTEHTTSPTTPTTPTTPTVPEFPLMTIALIGGGAVVAAVIVLVVYKKRTT